MRHLKCSSIHSSALNITYWTVSNEYNLLAIGLKDGNFRMFSFTQTDEVSSSASTSKTEPKINMHPASFLEMEVVAQHHEASITAITFLDSVKTVVTCAFDSSVCCLMILSPFNFILMPLLYFNA